ncbi:MAG: SCO family protein [Pseudomonadota bacterium]
MSVISVPQMLTRVAAVATLFAVTLGVQPAALAEVKLRQYSKPKVLKSFKLQDGSGKPFGNAQLNGRWTLVLMGFTHCPAVCPFTLQNLAAVKQELSTRVSPAKLPRVVFIGVDPDRDLENIGEYVKHFDDDFIGVSGEWTEIKKVVETMDGFVRIVGKEKDPVAYDVRHGATVNLLDAEGRLVVGIYPPLEPKSAAIFIAETMLKHARKQATN